VNDPITLRATEWVYQGVWVALVRLFRVPDEPPTLPSTPHHPARSFRPAPGFLRYLKFIFWLVLLIIDLLILFAFVIIASISLTAGAILLVPLLIVAILPDIIAFIAIHLRYDTTWYVLTDRSLRIRRGIWNITETTITFENIQSVTINQGPLQRHFAVADVQIETAGGGGGGGGGGKPGHAGASSHTGIIEGIDNAAEVRDLIMARVRASRSAGLGDERPDHLPLPEAAAEPRWTSAHLALVRETRDLCAALAR